MPTIEAFLKRHPLLTYFALVFAISWGAVLIVIWVGPGGIPATPDQFEGLLPFMGLAMIAGPSIAGILLTALLYGRAGLREFRSRLLRWRVRARWYAVALLTAPFLVTATLLALSLSSREFVPVIFTSDEKATLVLMGIVLGLMAGIFEELGWTGFAIPTLRRQRYGVLATGLIVGLLWGAWHLLVTIWGSGTTSGALSLAIFLPGMLFYLGSLPAYRVLMVWVYERTEESLLVAMLMHAAFSASRLIVYPLAIALVPRLTYDFVLAVVLWVIVGVVALANHGHLSRQPPLRRRVA